MSRYPFNDDNFWPMLAGVVNSFLETRVETQGPTLLDRDIIPSDTAFMRDLTLANMEFVLPDAGEAAFKIRNIDSGESLDFSNRAPSRGEMRANILRERLLLQREETPGFTLYEALDDIFRGDISKSDLMTYFITAMSYDQANGTFIDEYDKQLIKNAAIEMVRYKKANPTATDEEIIAHGQGFIPPNPTATDEEVIDQDQGFIPPNPEKKSNTVAKFFGFFLIALGITIAFAPIPGLAQVLGTWLTAMGLGISVGTFTLGLGLAAAAVGLAIFGFAFRSNQKSHIDQEYQETALPIAQQESDSALGSSLENSPSASPTAKQPSSRDLEGFKDNADIVSEISRSDSDLSEQAARLVDSVSTDSGASLAVAKNLAPSNDAVNEDNCTFEL